MKTKQQTIAASLAKPLVSHSPAAHYSSLCAIAQKVERVGWSESDLAASSAAAEEGQRKFSGQRRPSLGTLYLGRALRTAFLGLQICESRKQLVQSLFDSSHSKCNVFNAQAAL
jgi:hypothetical protein